MFVESCCEGEKVESAFKQPPAEAPITASRCHLPEPAPASPGLNPPITAQKV